MQCLGHSIQKRAADHGFAQVSDAARLRGLVADLRPVMRGDEDDRHQVAQGAQLSQQIQAGLPGAGRSAWQSGGGSAVEARKASPEGYVWTSNPDARSRRPSARAKLSSSSTTAT